MSQNDNSDRPIVSEKDTIVNQEESPNLSRRKMFGAGFMGFAAALATACSGTDFASSGANDRKKSKKSGSDGNDGFGESDGQDGLDSCENLPTDGLNETEIAAAKAKCVEDNPDGADGIGDIDGSDSVDGNNTDISDCDAYSTNKIDTTGMPELAEKPVIKFYGRNDSALVAMKFDGSLGIQQVIITTPTGKILALHGITGADKNGANFRPIVIDNIWLKEKGTDITEIYIILQMGAERKLHKEQVAFFTTYNSTPVVDLSGRMVPANWESNQSVTQFDKGTGLHRSDETTKYPNSDLQNTRFLQTAIDVTSWTKGTGVKGTITDIMGDDITSMFANDSKAIAEYQIFCTYVLSGGNMYRTILHIG